MIIKILPFIIFISSMWFMLSIRNNKDLLTIKVFGYSNLKIFLYSSTSFILGCCFFLRTLLHPQCQNIMKKLNQAIHVI